MEEAVQQINREEEELSKLNNQLRVRAQKFGADFTPLSMTDYKLFKIRKARETGNISYLQNILLEQIQDLQQRKNRIKQRIQQFYPQLKVQTQEKFFEQRQNPNFNEEDVTIREETWNLFGVDYMNNQKIRNYFHINPHFRIEWIHDSSCNIVFNSKADAQEAVLPLIRGDGMRDQNQVWYQLPEYQVQGIKRKLYCRVATSKDVKKKEIHGHNSQYYRWMINKQKLGNYVKREAHSQIMKTKGINRQNRYHRGRGDVVKMVKRQKKQEQSSSSGVSNSQQMEE